MSNIIVSSARQLRQSAVPLVRDDVSINPNLTKSEEATAAYNVYNDDQLLVSAAELHVAVPPFVPNASTSYNK